MTVRGRRAGLDAHCHALRGALVDGGDFCREADVDTPGHEILAPCLVEVGKVGEDNHRGVVGGDAKFVGRIPHAIGRRSGETLEHDHWNFWSSVAGAEK